GVRFAVVDVNLTVSTSKALRTGADVCGLFIVTGATISTGIMVALVDRLFAIGPLIAKLTETSIAIDQISADGIVLAGIGEAFVDVRFAVDAGVACRGKGREH